MAAIRISGSISEELNKGVERAMERTGKGFSQIIQEALSEKLQRDGHLDDTEAKEREILNICRGLSQEGIDPLKILTEVGGRELDNLSSGRGNDSYQVEVGA